MIIKESFTLISFSFDSVWVSFVSLVLNYVIENSTDSTVDDEASAIVNVFLLVGRI
jgi:hypothetical protein